MSSPRPTSAPLPRVPTPTPRPGTRLAGVLLLGLLGACASTPDEPAPAEDDPEKAVLDGVEFEPWKVSSTAEAEDAATGLLMTQLSNWITAWNKLVMTASTDQERQKFRVLDQKITLEVDRNFDTVEQQLRMGPPINRQVAAMAMGFARDERALSPLLGALEDSEDEVVANACMALGLLADDATPPGVLSDLMASENVSVRNNASWALSKLAKQGVDVEVARESMRRGLLDSDPGVRTHSAVTLARLLDAESIPDMTLLLSDGEPLVVKTASHAIAYIGTNDDHAKGTAARAMTAALGRIQGDSKDIVLRDLQVLSGRNFGEDEEAWLEWANRLPL